MEEVFRAVFGPPRSGASKSAKTPPSDVARDEPRWGCIVQCGRSERGLAGDGMVSKKPRTGRGAAGLKSA